MQRIFGLDIVRTIAILTVVYWHLFFIVPTGIDPYSTIGEVQFIDGVAIFFTLSGFLIGGILIKRLATGPVNFIALINFWRDRWFRTLPAYFTVLLIVFGRHLFVEHWPYLFFLQNMHTGAISFGESWSLSIEEWFYISIPILFFIGARKGIKTIPLLIALVIIVGNFIRIYMIHIYPPDNFRAFNSMIKNVVPARIDAIIYGVLGAYLAFYKKEAWYKYRNISFVIGLVGYTIIHFINAFSASNINFFVLYFYLPLQGVFTLMVLPKMSSIKTGKGSIAKAITFIAILSYSIYLVHMTLFISCVGRFLPNKFWIKLPFYLVWAFGAAWVLNRFIEKPFLKFRDRNKKKSNSSLTTKIPLNPVSISSEN